LLSWQFNAFSCSTDDLPVFVIMMFRHLQLFEKFTMTESSLRTFVLSVRLAYPANPYHNFTHAFDVTHALFCMLTKFGLRRWLRPIDELSLLIAAISHDLAHPGVNNAYLIATNAPLASLYNDISVLENHHCATAFRIMNQPEINLLGPLNAADRVELRKSVITCILATDMARHQSITDSIASHLAHRSTNAFDRENAAHREILMISLMKFCDISNVFKDTTLADLWMLRITQEYFLQGDEMRRRLMIVPEMMDRHCARPRQEITRSFITHVASPFFERCVAPILLVTDASLLRNNMVQNEAALRANVVVVPM